MDQSVKNQLEKWVEGTSIHNTERDECCPDFSCCQKEYLAPKHEREAFAKAVMEDNHQVAQQMLMGFLSASMGGYSGGRVMHIAGSVPDTPIQ
jgi:hypothetical protein